MVADAVGNGKLSALVSAFLEGGGPGEGDIVGADFHAPFVQHAIDKLFLVHTVYRRVNHYRVQVEYMVAFRLYDGKRQAGYITKSFADIGGIVNAPLIQFIKF